MDEMIELFKTYNYYVFNELNRVEYIHDEENSSNIRDTKTAIFFKLANYLQKPYNIEIEEIQELYNKIIGNGSTDPILIRRDRALLDNFVRIRKQNILANKPQPV